MQNETINYDSVRFNAFAYQNRPTKAAEIRLERQVSALLQLTEQEEIGDFEYHINEADMWWYEVLTFLKDNQTEHARDLFIGALIDILNERDLLSNEPPTAATIN